MSSIDTLSFEDEIREMLSEFNIEELTSCNRVITKLIEEKRLNKEIAKIEIYYETETCDTERRSKLYIAKLIYSNENNSIERNFVKTNRQIVGDKMILSGTVMLLTSDIFEIREKFDFEKRVETRNLYCIFESKLKLLGSFNDTFVLNLIEDYLKGLLTLNDLIELCCNKGEFKEIE